MDQELTQSDLDDLSAYMDGELTGEAKWRVEHLLKEDSRWPRALRQLQELDACLDTYSVPAAPADLAAKIIASLPSQNVSVSPVWKIIRWLAPLGAAAAVVIAATSLFRPAPRPQVPIAQGDAGASAKVDDQFVVENLSFFSDYDVVRDLETIEAIEQVQSQTVGT